MATAAVSLSAPEATSERLQSLFREHCDFVYRTAYSVTGNRLDAEDALQTIFLRLLQHGVPDGFSRNPKAYLYRAAINQALNSNRSRNRRRELKETEGVDQVEAPAFGDGDNERQQTLLHAISQLKPEDIELLLLRYSHDYSDAQIARMLGKSRGAVAVNLYRARARLKKLIRAGGQR